MSGLMLCTMRAQKPYYIKEINKNIYSIEELSFYLYNYLYLVEDRFFSEGLIEYLDTTLELKSVADGLKQIKNREGSLGEMISFVVKNSGFYSAKEVEELERHLVMLNSKTSSERIKGKADILMDNHKYNLAIIFYKNILNKGRNADLSDEFYGDIYYNLGVAYSRMFEYATAANYFKTAYKLNDNIRILDSVVLADLLDGNDKRLKRDQSQYKISDLTINKLRAKIMSIKSETEADWEEKTIDANEFVKNCKKEYFVEINA